MADQHSAPLKQVGLECSVQLLEQAAAHGINIDEFTGVVGITDGPHQGSYRVVGFEERPATPPEVEGRHVVWLRPLEPEPAVDPDPGMAAFVDDVQAIERQSIQQHSPEDQFVSTEIPPRMSQLDRDECWACGEPLPDDRPFFTLDIRSVRPRDPPPAPYRLGEFAVHLCLECNSLTKRLLEHIRAARFRPVPEQS